MAIQHYKGELGEFEYNDKIFSVQQEKYSDNSTYEILSYIGSETDGSKIEIPQGILDCTAMFMDSALVTPPVIPDGVECCALMFFRCHNLLSSPLIPESVVITYGMFAGCVSLISVSDIFDKQSHNGVSADKMFYGCEKLESVSSIPIRVMARSLIFGHCTKLKKQQPINDCLMQHYSGELGEFNYNPEEFQLVYIQGPSDIDFDFDIQMGSLQIYDNLNDQKPGDVLECLYYIGYETDGSKVTIPKGITNCRYMFAGSSFTTPPVIPDGVVDCTAMFASNLALLVAPTIPSSVRICSQMFADCMALTIPSTPPSTVKYCDRMYSWCSSLTSTPEVPSGACRRNMFEDCEQLPNYEELCELDSEDKCPYHAANNNKERNE